MAKDKSKPQLSDVIQFVKRIVKTPKLDAQKQPVRDEKSKNIIYEENEVALSESEVLTFKVTENGVVTVVTNDGQKFMGSVESIAFAKIKDMLTKSSTEETEEQTKPKPDAKKNKTKE